MKLLDTLNRLHAFLETARNTTEHTEESLTQTYNDLSKRFDILATYQASDDVSVPNLQLVDIKRELKAMRNTFYSAYTAFLDKEITATAYTRQLGILTVKASEITSRVSTAYIRSSLIAHTNIDAEPITEKPNVLAAINTDNVFRDLREMQENIRKAEKDSDASIEMSEKDLENIDLDNPLNVKYIRNKLAAPSSPEGYRNLNDKGRQDVNDKKREQEQDESARNVLLQYQPELQKLAAITTPSNLDWTVARGPIFFSSSPILQEFQIKGLKCKHDAFFPGWILSNQYLLGIKPSLLKDKKQLVLTLRYITETMAQRHMSKFVYAALPSVNLTVRSPVERLVTKTEKSDATVKQLKKEKLRESKKLETRILNSETNLVIPRFIGLPGSKLIWTWLFPEHLYNALPRIKIKDFGFPVASEMRTLDDRLKKRIVPELRNNTVLVDEVVKKYRLQIEHEYAEQSKPIDAEIEFTREKIKKAKGYIDDLVARFKGQQIQLEKLQHDLTMAGIVNLRERLKADIKIQEDKLAAMSGQVNGYKSIVKNLELEASKLKKQKENLLINLRQEAAQKMREEQQALKVE
jgi:hypothetical protein